MTAPQPRVVPVDPGTGGPVPMSALLAEAERPRAVVVALHGGGTTAAYFDCPGHPRLSLLRLGAAAGFTVLALDRPGYGASAPYPEAMQTPQQRVELAYGAIAAVLGERPRGAGIFVLAHSNGCELAVRLAADPARGADLLGLALAGTGMRYRDAAAAALRDAAPDRRPTGLRELLWEPARLYPPGVAASPGTGRAGARYEAAMVADWPRTDFPALAPRVRVPVLFSRAEHERVWHSDEAAAARIAALFSSCPRFVTEQVADAGHNLSLGWSAAAYHLRVLAFAEECVVARVHAGELGGATELEVEAG